MRRGSQACEDGGGDASGHGQSPSVALGSSEQAQETSRLQDGMECHVESLLLHCINLLKVRRESIKYKLAASVPPWAVFPAGLLLVYLFIFKAGCPGDRCLVDFMEWAEEMGQKRLQIFIGR